MTKGYTTTEFYTTLIANVVAILALFHVGLPSNTPALTQALAVLAAGIATGIYTHSRQQVKVAYANQPQATPTPTPTPVSAT